LEVDPLLRKARARRRIQDGQSPARPVHAAFRLTR
jgi:hypothetical protein